jgi:hypothetical protein
MITRTQESLTTLESFIALNIERKGRGRTVRPLKFGALAARFAKV